MNKLTISEDEYIELSRKSELWNSLRAQLERSRDTGFREKTVYALMMMKTLEEESQMQKGEYK